jgi:hypothetical protein
MAFLARIPDRPVANSYHLSRSIMLAVRGRSGKHLPARIVSGMRSG